MKSSVKQFISIILSGMGLGCLYVEPMLNTLVVVLPWKQCRDSEQLYSYVSVTFIEKEKTVSTFSGIESSSDSQYFLVHKKYLMINV